MFRFGLYVAREPGLGTRVVGIGELQDMAREEVIMLHKFRIRAAGLVIVCIVDGIYGRYEDDLRQLVSMTVTG